jgi:photosystem II stability/assembly factor-like uncharacterized protein
MKRILIIFLCSIALHTNAQWISSSCGAYVECIDGTNLNNLFACANAGALFYSQDTALHWNLVNGISYSPSTIAISGNDLFLGTDIHGIYHSSDNGATWSAVNNGFSNLYVYDIIFNGTDIFAGMGGGIFLSTNNGSTWALKSSIAANSLAVNSGTLFAGTNGLGILRSTDNGNTWNYVNTGLTFASEFVHGFAFSGSNIFAATEGGVFLSTNNGSSWSSVSTGLISTYVYDVAISGNLLFAATQMDGIFLSTDYGNSWSVINDNILPQTIESIFIIDSYVFIGSGSNGKVYHRPLSEITGIEDMNQNTTLTLSPNPVTNQLTVTSQKARIKEIKIMNSLGEEMKNWNLGIGNEKSATVDVSGIVKGIYFIQLTDENKNSINKKIIIQ